MNWEVGEEHAEDMWRGTCDGEERNSMSFKQKLREFEGYSFN